VDPPYCLYVFVNDTPHRNHFDRNKQDVDDSSPCTRPCGDRSRSGHHSSGLPQSVHHFDARYQIRRGSKIGHQRRHHRRVRLPAMRALFALLIANILIKITVRLLRPRPLSNGRLRATRPRSTWPPLRHFVSTLVLRVSHHIHDDRAESNVSEAAWKDMANVYVNTCSDTAPGQNWTVMADGRIAVTASAGTRKSCIIVAFDSS